MARRATPDLDFEALMSAEYAPTRVNHVVSREKYQASSSNQDDLREAMETLSLSHPPKDDDTSRLVHSLVAQTPTYKRHSPKERKDDKFYETFTLPLPKKLELPPVPPEFHDVECCAWELKIPWNRDYKPERPMDNFLAVLDQPRNHHLDYLDLADAVAPHTREDFLRKARNVPLVLELGVAGQSVSKAVYQNTALSAQHPPSAAASEAYIKRVERESRAAGTDNSRSSANGKDKAGNRPGRTGQLEGKQTQAGFHRIEHILQLDLVNNHSMVPSDWPKAVLRQHLRPKLPKAVVRPWQFQIRNVSGSSTPTKRLRTEADLSPTEGKLILLEYSEERPPIRLTKGMCSKIVNYYRGDRADCPVSAGGGDRPSRRGGETRSPTNKRHIASPNVVKINDNVLDWVGKLPEKSDRVEKEATPCVREGVTEILHNKVHGPFIGPIEEGQVVTGVVSNLFVAPMFRQEPQSSDFLMMLTPLGGPARAGKLETVGVVLRDLPASTFVVGQTEPRTKVQAPNSKGEQSFMKPFLEFQIARQLHRSMIRGCRGLTLDAIKDRTLSSLEILETLLRERLKGVATFEKERESRGIWTMKQTGVDDFAGLDGLSRNVAPEGIAAFESASAARCRLYDLGIVQLVEKKGYTVKSIDIVVNYLATELNATRKVFERVEGNCKFKGNGVSPFQTKIFEEARDELEGICNTLERRLGIARFIYEELQLAPWNLTKEFIDVHINGEGTGMMRLTGLGDPTDIREGFSFLRVPKTKPSASTPKATIVGTDKDLRKLNVKQLEHKL